MLARIRTLSALLERDDYKGFDPFDFANSPLLARIPDSWHLPHVVLSKFGARLAPDSVRRALRVPPIEDPKTYACAYFAYRMSGIPELTPRADEMLDRLAALGTANGGPVYWGYDYLWATRGSGVSPRGGSTLVPGSFALLAVMHDTVSSGTDRWSDLMRSALTHYRTAHWCATEAGEFLGYFPRIRTNTHNANLLGCVALTVGGRLFSDDRCLRSAATAAATSLAAVRPDGYMPYRDRAGDWTDCFHHLYVLASVRALAALNPYLDRGELDSTATRLEAYYRRHFLRTDGRVNYFPDRLHPIDPHNYAATAIYHVLAQESPDDAVTADQILRRIDEDAWDERRGRYSYRIHRHRRDRRFFTRWSQVWMLMALCAVHAGPAVRADVERTGRALLAERTPIAS
jgi:hypothetical protein